MKICWSCKKEVARGASSCPHCKVSLSQNAINLMATIRQGGAPKVQIIEGILVSDRYEIVREIGRGGMGIVYLAYDRIMERQVAVKVIPQELCMDPRVVADLKREAGIAIDLTHANIVRLHTLDSWEGQAFIVMEYVGGGTLAHLLVAGALTLDRALPYLRQIAAALDYSHKANPPVIHRDLKPLNILLAEDGTIVKVADFGLARALRDSASRITGQDSAGTLAYMAPEQIRGKGVGRETDVYAFAAIAYEMLSGHPPFYTGDLRWQILHEDVEPIFDQPDQVNTALKLSLSKDGESRPESAGDLIALLAGEIDITTKDRERTINGNTKSGGPTPVIQGKRDRRRMWSVMFAVLLLIVLGYGGWWYYQGNMPQLLRGGPILVVSSEPPGATLYVDEGRVGQTPAVMAKLSDGTHTVRLEKENYQSHIEKIFIQQDQATEISAKLVLAPFGDLKITSTPPGAMITIDSKDFGTTPARLENLTQGNRHLQLQRQGFDQWEQQVDILPQQVMEVEAILVPASGQLSVTSEPAGAVVYQNGQKLGITPYSGEVAKGKNTIELRLEKYLDWRGEVVVTPREKATLHGVLQTALGRLNITSVPAGALVKIDGQEAGATPLSLEHLLGNVAIEFSAAFYKSVKKQVQVKAGEETMVAVNLESVMYADQVTGMQFVRVPGGCFEMGDTVGDGADDEKPAHEVCVDGFFLSKFEVTQGEYLEVTGKNPSYFTKGNSYPVESVSWNDVQEFIIKLNGRSGRVYRLPTEAEWEYAARSGVKTDKYAGGDEIDILAWYSGNSNGVTHPVGQKKSNGLGLYDMSGNVREWCQDSYESDYYSKSSRVNPKGPRPSSFRVFRGGSFESGPWPAKVSSRNNRTTDYINNNLGFRIILPIQSLEQK